MKKWYLLAISLVGLISCILAIITDEKLFFLLSSLSVVTTSSSQLWMAFRKRKPEDKKDP
jgi:hypothetical protein